MTAPTWRPLAGYSDARHRAKDAERRARRYREADKPEQAARAERLREAYSRASIAIGRGRPLAEVNTSVGAYIATRHPAKETP